ncbi:MAG: thiamine diphosphokinase [Clostridiales bacterium]|jgi:thiamine pyrophosphokinase|nr:thiamine diphosphokinase [Clostridiales bacterium]
MNQVIEIIICVNGLHDTKNQQAVCHIVCAGEDSGSIAEPRPGDYTIAADGGLCRLEKAGAAPDLIIGDFDSLGYVPDAGNVVKLKSEKDDTDTMAAVRIGLEKGYRMFYIHCGLGGRLDHTLANIQTLAFILKYGGIGLLFGKDEAAVMTSGVLEFSGDMKGYVSVFSYSGQAYGVCIDGLKYDLKDAVLNSAFPLGVSNEFIGRKGRVCVKKGIILVIYSRSA